MKAPGRCTNHQGFTLIESLVALSIFAFSLVVLAYLMNSTMQTDLEARRITAATTLAQQKLEQLRNLSYSAVSSASPETLNEAGGTTGSTLYTRSWTVTNDSPMNGMKTVQVTTAWTDRSGSHQVRLQTILTP